MNDVELALVGGRVIDPETGLDGIRHVGLTAGRVVRVTTEPLSARRQIDVAGCVVAPGFIDLHSHAQTRVGARLQSMDGVTTALELEAGTLPFAATNDAVRDRPIHFGYSASWALARLSVMCGLEWHPKDGDTPIEFFEEAQAHPQWGEPASPRELDAIRHLLGSALDDGALGIGMLLGYAPDTDPAEFEAVAALAARHRVPIFTHSRTMSMHEPGTSLEGIREIIAVASASGAHVHVCHLNSTSLRQIEEIRALVLDAQSRGVRLTTETYPYGAGSTGIGADFFAPDRFSRLGTATTALTYLPTGERVADLARLESLRRADPGGLCIIDILDPDIPDDLRLLLASVTLPGGLIASDAMPLTFPVASAEHRDAWPPSVGATAHPRSAGTFSRVLRWLVRELEVFDLGEAIERMSLGPARLLEDSVPAMRRKGRVQVGADADLVVFDPEHVSDTATFSALSTSVGIEHVFVAGEAVVADGEPVFSAAPGRAIVRARA